MAIFIKVSAGNTDFQCDFLVLPCFLVSSPLSLSLLLCTSVHPEPNDESGANVDASKMWREDREQFYKLAQKIVRKSLSL